MSGSAPALQLPPEGGQLRADLVGHGPVLGIDLHWATAWQHNANDWIAPRIGLPDLPSSSSLRTPPGSCPSATSVTEHWKTETIAAAMHGRFFVCVDDDATAADSDYLAARHYGGAAVYRVDPAVGLLPGDIEAIQTITEPGPYSGQSRLDLRRRAKSVTS